jgi:hypothetical protein
MTRGDLVSGSFRCSALISGYPPARGYDRQKSGFGDFKLFFRVAYALRFHFEMNIGLDDYRIIHCFDV